MTAQQTAFESYINGGGGYVGVHAAADTEYGWPYYGQLVGAWFNSHPAIQQVTARVEDHNHPSTAHLGDDLGADGRVVQLLDQPAAERARADQPGRVDLQRRQHGRSPDRLVPRARLRPLVLHRVRAHHRVVLRPRRSGSTSSAASSTPPASARRRRSPRSRARRSPRSPAYRLPGTVVPAAAQTLGYIDNGDWAGYSQVSTGRQDHLHRANLLRWCRRHDPDPLRLRTGPILGTVAVPVTGGWETFQTVTTTLTTSGTGPLFLTFTGGPGSLFDIDNFSLS